MKHYKVRHIPAHDDHYEDFVTCDLCGERLRKDSSYEYDDAEILHRKGSDYPEGTHITETTFDLCGACFRTKLIPWLKGQGAEPQTHELGY